MGTAPNNERLYLRTGLTFLLLINSLCLKNQDFDFGDMKEIRFAAYLRFRQRYVLISFEKKILSNDTLSHSSVADDSVEEHKLLSQNREKARLRELAGDESEEDEGGGGIAKIGEGEPTIEQLRETIKTERDQKVYIRQDLWDGSRNDFMAEVL